MVVYLGIILLWLLLSHVIELLCVRVGVYSLLPSGILCIDRLLPLRVCEALHCIALTLFYVYVDMYMYISMYVHVYMSNFVC